MSNFSAAATYPQVDIVVPVYNEEDAVSAFHQQLRDVIDSLPYRFTICYVNDGSSDQTSQCLTQIAEQDSRVAVIELSRNFGHQAALTAGLDQSDGDYVITMDGDGQHPPQLIPEMLKLAEDGYEIVLSQRIEEEGISPFKRWTSSIFYNLINRIGDTQILPGGADFRLLTKVVVQNLKNMHEYHRFLRGMVAWMGFRTIVLPFKPPQRLAGKSKYTTRKMLHLGADAVFSFSLAPLYFAVSIGALFLFLALVEMIYVLSFWISGNTQNLAPGWSSLMFMLLIVGGSLMITLGFIGIYIGYIFQEVKGRPVYMIRSTLPAASSNSIPKETDRNSSYEKNHSMDQNL